MGKEGGGSHPILRSEQSKGVRQPCHRTLGTRGRCILKFHTHATIYYRLVAGIGHADYHQGGHSAMDSNLACRTADHYTEVSGHR